MSPETRPGTSPAFTGRLSLLRPVLPGDYGYVYELETTGDALVTYRHRGRVPSFETAMRSLTEGVLTQLLVVHRRDGVPLGLVNAHSANHRDGHVELAVIRDAERHEVPAFFEGLFLFIDYLFEVWPIRVVYAHSIEFNYAHIASGAGAAFVVEGRLRNHTFHGGRHWDLLILAIHRDAWQSYRAARAPLVHQAQGSPDPHMGQ